MLLTVLGSVRVVGKMWKKIVLLAFFSIFLLSVMVINRSIAAPPEATVFVHPEESVVKVYEIFTVDVSISDVSGLQGFDFVLAYDTSILDCLEVVEGPFMASGGPTFVIKMEVEDECTAKLGRVWVVIVIYGDKWADGSGTLATVTFKATSPGETVLNLSSELVTCSSEWIPHIDVNGYVVVSPDPADPPDPVDPPNPAGSQEIPGDFDGDFDVDFWDILTFTDAYREYGNAGLADVKCDFDLDGDIDFWDILAFGDAYRAYGT